VAQKQPNAGLMSIKAELPIRTSCVPRVTMPNSTRKMDEIGSEHHALAGRLADLRPRLAGSGATALSWARACSRR
jgi:hypothetical protein